MNLLKLSVDAARARCTLGEICDALEAKWARHVPTRRVIQGAYKSEYGSAEQDEFDVAVKTIAAFAKEEGRQPRLLVAKLGQDGHDRGAAVIASGFADMGFDVDVSPMFSTPEECAQAAIDGDVHVVGVSSQAAGHKTLVPAIVKALKAKGGEHIIVVVGGVIPPADYQFLYDSGAKVGCSLVFTALDCADAATQAIFGPGTRVPKAAVRCCLCLRAAQTDVRSRASDGRGESHSKGPGQVTTQQHAGATNGGAGSVFKKRAASTRKTEAQRESQERVI